MEDDETVVSVVVSLLGVFPAVGLLFVLDDVSSVELLFVVDVALIAVVVIVAVDKTVVVSAVVGGTVGPRWQTVLSWKTLVGSTGYSMLPFTFITMHSSHPKVI